MNRNLNNSNPSMNVFSTMTYRMNEVESVCNYLLNGIPNLKVKIRDRNNIKQLVTFMEIFLIML